MHTSHTGYTHFNGHFSAEHGLAKVAAMHLTVAKRIK